MAAQLKRSPLGGGVGAVLEVFFRYFWLFGFLLTIPNYLMLRPPTVRRLIEAGAAPDDSSAAFNAAALLYAVLLLPMFAIQWFSSTPNMPLLLFFPHKGGAALASFALFVVWQLIFLGTLWFHKRGLLIASASCQGLLGPSQARLALTAAPLILFPILFVVFAAL